MSVYFHVYAGPVLVCKYHNTETVEKETIKFVGCSNAACKHNNPKHRLDGPHYRGEIAKFCPKCGSPTVSIERVKEKVHKEKSVPGIYDLMSEGGFREDALGDELWGGLNCEEIMPGYDVFELPKVGTGYSQREFAIHRQNPDIAEDNKDAAMAYEKEIAYLRTRYDSVEIQWMIATNGR